MMIPGEGRDALKSFRKFSNLKDHCSEDQHLECGIAMALADLWESEGHHPARIAALALEEENYHNEAAILFEIADH